MFYAYIHCRADGVPFYVGKGTEKRTRDFKRNRNPHYLRTIDKYGTGPTRLVLCADEKAAFDMEKTLIKELRARGISLTNMSDGGEGQSGWSPSAETRAKISAAGVGRVKKPETLELMRRINIGKKMSPAAIEKMRAVDRGYLKLRCGESHPNYGKKFPGAGVKIAAAIGGKAKPRTNCSVCGKSVSNNVLHRFHEGKCAAAFKVYTEGKTTE